VNTMCRSDDVESAQHGTQSCFLFPLHVVFLQGFPSVFGTCGRAPSICPCFNKFKRWGAQLTKMPSASSANLCYMSVVIDRGD
jgi:hypothetical protein